MSDEERVDRVKKILQLNWEESEKLDQFKPTGIRNSSSEFDGISREVIRDRFITHLAEKLDIPRELLESACPIHIDGEWYEDENGNPVVYRNGEWIKPDPGSAWTLDSRSRVERP